MILLQHAKHENTVLIPVYSVYSVLIPVYVYCVDGFWFNPKRPGQPDFVIGGVSFSKAKFIEWLEKQEADERGYVKAQILKSKSDGKPYAVLDTWKPDGNFKKSTSQGQYATGAAKSVDQNDGNGDIDDVIPF